MSSELKELRKKLGLGQAEMADMLAISRSKLALVESGKRKLQGSQETVLQQLKDSVASQSISSEKISEVVEKARLNGLKKLQVSLRKQEHELRNLIYSLDKFKEKCESSKKALALICEEIQIFSAMPNYSARLQKMHSEATKNCLKYSAENIELIELRIEVLKISVELFRNKLASK